MKIIIVFLLMVFGCSRSSMAQLDRTAFPFSYLNTNVKSLSLGNATVSLNTFGNEEINPAVIGEEGILQISPSWYNYVDYMEWKHRGLKTNYRLGQSIFGFSFQRIAAGKQVETIHTSLSFPFIHKIGNYDLDLSASYSHVFKNGLTIGVGVNYLYSSEASATTVSAEMVKPDDSWSVDLGANYQFPEARFNDFALRPHLGVSLTDFGTPSDYIRSETEYPMPTTLRIGGGANIILNKKAYGRKVMEVSVLQNVSKILARIEIKSNENGLYADAMNPFKALIRSWGTYEYYDGYVRGKSDLSEQLWWHSGVELKLLEAIALRWGYQNAAKVEEPLSYRALGVGIDLYYLVFDYTHIKNDEDDNLLVGHHWQITGRIPLDGKRPDTILNVLFD
ncbi:PorV/PorQ family protein [Gracilimonas mengyeensis]|nr:PorV/PorQ family protein [Gracilimonas mengyeensis]